MREVEKLQIKLKELKLEKRQILLAGKGTEEIDFKIKEIEQQIRDEE